MKAPVKHHNSSYTLLARLVVMGLGLAFLAACGGGGSGGGGEAGAAFTVTSSLPASGAVGVLLDASVDVTFSAEIDPDTVTSESLIVGEIGGFGTITGTTSLLADGTGRTLRWVGNDFLRSDAPHNCRIAGTLKSVSGAAISGGLQFQFRTVGGTTPDPLPTAGQMRPTFGQLNMGRESHRATLLGSGQVLVTGGFSAGAFITDRAELFDPTTESWTLLSARMVEERAAHTATRLNDGRILICGGWVQTGVDDILTTNSAEVYNPASGTFQTIDGMHEERADHVATLLPDGRVLITGGSRLAGAFLADLDTAEVFDPQTNTFTELTATLIHTRAAHGAAWAPGNRLVLGGGSDEDFRTGRFDFGTMTFSDLGQGAAVGTRFGCCVEAFASGGVAIIGGDALGAVEHVFPLTELVVNSGSGLTRPRSYATATRYRDDAILVTGGIDFSDGGFLLGSCDVVIEGGVGGSRTFGTELRLATSTARHTATVLDDGRIVICGGIAEVYGQLNVKSSQVFTP